MDLTNNPVEGTGYSVADAATNIESLLDSDTATTETVDADETPEVSNTDEIEIDETDDGSDQAEEVEAGVDASGETEEVETSRFDIPDDATVEINGNTVTGKELKLGYLRQADYTKKSQELAESKRRYDAGQVDANQLRAEQKQALDHYGRLLSIEFQGLSEPDWATLAVESPAEYVAKKEEWNRKNALVKAHFDAVADLDRKNAEFQRNFHIESQKKAFEEMGNRYSEFKDPKTSDAVLGQIETYLRGRGFGDADIESIANPEIIDIVYRALKYDQQQVNVQKAVKHVESKPRITSPGTGTKSASTADQKFRADANRLKQTGSINDAAALISRLL